MKRRMWEIKNIAQDNSSADIYIYSDIESDYYDWWNDKLIKSETSATSFREKLDELSDIKNLNIYINSIGGSVYEGIAIFSQLKRCNAYKTVYIDGYACSIASVIAMAADKICMYSPSVMMIHNAGMYCYGNSIELRKQADDLDKIDDSIRNAYLEKTNGKISEEKLIELMNAETYLTSTECLMYGFADEILSDNRKTENYAENLNSVSIAADRMRKVAACAAASNISMLNGKTENFCCTLPNIPEVIDKTESNERKMKIFEDFLGGKLNVKS